MFRLISTCSIPASLPPQYARIINFNISLFDRNTSFSQINDVHVAGLGEELSDLRAEWHIKASQSSQYASFGRHYQL